MGHFYYFLVGMVVMGCFASGLFFLKFWKQTRDRLFLIFAVAFWILAINWFALALIQKDELRTALYAVRFLAFSLILIGIVDKNRSTDRG